MKQIELLAKAIELAGQNPEAEIHILAFGEEILDDYAWTAHKISRVELGWWYECNDSIYTEPYELADELTDMQEKEVTEDDAIKLMESAILIYTGAG